MTEFKVGDIIKCKNPYKCEGYNRPLITIDNGDLYMVTNILFEDGYITIRDMSNMEVEYIFHKQFIKEVFEVMKEEDISKYYLKLIQEKVNKAEENMKIEIPNIDANSYYSINIPEGYNAKIEGDKVIFNKNQPREFKFEAYLDEGIRIIPSKNNRNLLSKLIDRQISCFFEKIEESDVVEDPDIKVSKWEVTMRELPCEEFTE